VVQIITGISIGATKLFNPFLLVGGILTAVSTGLMMTLQADSSHSIWIGCQALAGIGLGLCVNVYIIIVQNIMQPDEVATATVIILCKFTILFLFLILPFPSSVVLLTKVPCAHGLPVPRRRPDHLRRTIHLPK
jgi:hypothetical protein